VYSLITEAGFAHRSWLGFRPVSPSRRTACASRCPLLLQGLLCVLIFTSALHCPLRFTPSAAPQHLPALWSFSGFALHTFTGFTGQNFHHLLTAFHLHLPPHALACALSTDVPFIELRCRLPRLLHRFLLHDSPPQDVIQGLPSSGFALFHAYPCMLVRILGSLALTSIRAFLLASFIPPVVSSDRPCHSDCFSLGRGDFHFSLVDGCRLRRQTSVG